MSIESVTPPPSHPASSELPRSSDSTTATSDQDVVIETSPWREPLKAGKLQARSEISSHDTTSYHRFPKLSYLRHPSERTSYNLDRQIQVALDHSRSDRLLLEQRGLLSRSGSVSASMSLAKQRGENKNEPERKERSSTSEWMLEHDRQHNFDGTSERVYSIADYDSEVINLNSDFEQDQSYNDSRRSLWSFFPVRKRRQSVRCDTRTSIRSSDSSIMPLRLLTTLDISRSSQGSELSSMLSSDGQISLTRSERRSSLRARRSVNRPSTCGLASIIDERLSGFDEPRSQIYATETSRLTADGKNRELAEALGENIEDIQEWFSWMTRYWKGEVSIFSATSPLINRRSMIAAPYSPMEVERINFFQEAEHLILHADTICREQGINFHLRRLWRALGHPTMVSVSLFTEKEESIISCYSTNSELKSLRTLPREVSLGFHALLHNQEPTYAIQNLKDHWLFRNNPLTLVFALRYYCAVPLIVDGHAVGLLALYDSAPRQCLDPAESDPMKLTCRKIQAILVSLRKEALRPPRVSTKQKQQTTVAQKPERASMNLAGSRALIKKLFRRHSMSQKRETRNVDSYRDVLQQPLMSQEAL